MSTSSRPFTPLQEDASADTGSAVTGSAVTENHVTWPYHVRPAFGTHQEGTLLLGLLIRGHQAVAHVNTTGDDGHTVTDVHFGQPQPEADFLTWLDTVPLPAGLERTPEAVCGHLLSADPLGTPVSPTANPTGDLSEVSAHALRQLSEVLGYDVTASGTLDAPAISSAPPMDLGDACLMAARWYERTRHVTLMPGVRPDLETARRDAQVGLGHLSQLLLDGHPDHQNPDAWNGLGLYLLNLLAALAAGYGRTESGDWQAGTAERLHTDAFTLTSQALPNLIGMSQPTRPGECLHKTLLRASALLLCAADRTDPAEVLRQLTELMRALTVVSGMDVNAWVITRLNADRTG